MKKSVVCLFAAFAAFATIQSSNAQVIADWTFETTSNSITGSGLSLGPLAADIGSGSASGTHASSTTWSHPAGNGSPSSFSATAWAVGDYFQFNVSTLGFSGIQLSFDQSSSNTRPGIFGLFYSVNGGSYTQFGVNYNVLPNAAPNPTWNINTYNSIYTSTFDLSSITALNNAASVSFRLVDMSTTSANGGTVAVGGTDRVDNFVVSVPEPSTLVLAGLGGAASLLAFRRRR